MKEQYLYLLKIIRLRLLISPTIVYNLT